MRLHSLFRRPRAEAALDSAEDLRRAVSSVAFVLEEGAPPAARVDPRARLLRVVAEAVLLQDKAEELLADIRAREPLAELAPRGGPLAARFFELRRSLPAPVGREMARQCATVGVVLDHHGMLIVSALDMLAVDWRSQAIVEQLERLDGLGAPAERLDAVYAELAY